jgi:hypothetical protein
LRKTGVVTEKIEKKKKKKSYKKPCFNILKRNLYFIEALYFSFREASVTSSFHFTFACLHQCQVQVTGPKVNAWKRKEKKRERVQQKLNKSLEQGLNLSGS